MNRACALSLVSLFATTTATAQEKRACSDDSCTSGLLLGGLGVHRTDTDDGTESHDRRLYGLYILSRMMGVDDASAGDWTSTYGFGIGMRLDVKSDGGPPAGGIAWGGGYGKLYALGVAPVHGPFGRLEGESSFWVDGDHTQFALDLPMLAAGYGVYGSKAAFEFAALGALMIIGTEKFLVTQSAYRMGILAPEAGARVSFFWRPVSLEARYLRWWTRDEPHAIADRANALACVSVWYLVGCGDASYARLRYSDTDANAVSVGVIVGAGIGGHLGDLDRLGR